ncbi:MAG: thiamine-phosphate kinase, partial [Candidatus Latescibacteria bacterium]|nr:thiamine-phosphate kinase [Candidatus Latescibacterota bacterium]
VTVDTMVEGVHFVHEVSPEGVGHKLLAVSLSDVAAMGGRPTDAVVAVSAPGDCDAGYVERLYNGIFSCADRFGVAIAGGDTTRTSGSLVLSLTLTGEMARERVCYRSGAQVGDAVYVSGTLGDAAGGLAVMLGEVNLEGDDRQYLLRRLHRPEPRVALGQALSKANIVTAMIDVSDGVASDLKHICKQSGVSAIIFENAIPTSSAFDRFCAMGGQSSVNLALGGGEDYELLFTVRPEKVEILDALSEDFSFYRMGEVVEGSGQVILETEDGTRVEVENAGYDHFR